MQNTTTQKQTIHFSDELNPVISKLLFIANSLGAWDDLRLDIDEDSRYGLSFILDDVIANLRESIKKSEGLTK